LIPPPNDGLQRLKTIIQCIVSSSFKLSSKSFSTLNVIEKWLHPAIALSLYTVLLRFSHHDFLPLLLWPLTTSHPPPREILVLSPLLARNARARRNSPFSTSKFEQYKLQAPCQARACYRLKNSKFASVAMLAALTVSPLLINKRLSLTKVRSQRSLVGLVSETLGRLAFNLELATLLLALLSANLLFGGNKSAISGKQMLGRSRLLIYILSTN
jgi:hypothetical protein